VVLSILVKNYPNGAALTSSDTRGRVADRDSYSESILGVLEPVVLGEVMRNSYRKFELHCFLADSINLYEHMPNTSGKF